MNNKIAAISTVGVLLGAAVSLSEPVEAQQTDSYTVQAGDTLYHIGMRKGVNVPQLQASNPDITDPNVIYAGQTIVLPFQQPGPSSQTADLYVVREADTLSGIARRRGTSVSDITAANDLSDPDYIVVGQELLIPGTASEDPSDPFPATPTDHTVEQGDTLSGIASQYGLTAEDLFDNNIMAVSDPDLIYPGQVLLIP